MRFNLKKTFWSALCFCFFMVLAAGSGCDGCGSGYHYSGATEEPDSLPTDEQEAEKKEPIVEEFLSETEEKEREEEEVFESETEEESTETPEKEEFESETGEKSTETPEEEVLEPETGEE